MADNRPVIANLDFEDIKQDIIDYISSKEEFKDYEFTGSGLNVLIDILAYNTHYNALAANFLVNEMFIDTAVVRDNVVSIAKSLNYQPRSATAAKTTLTVDIVREDDELSRTLPAGTLFTAKDGNYTLNFYTIDDYTVQYEALDTSKEIDIEIYQGNIVTQRFVQDRDNIRFASFDLLNQNIDTATITAVVNGNKYIQIVPEDEGITATTDQSLIYFIEETRNNSHKVIFGNGVIGKALEANDEVIVTYLITNGPDGNGVRNFSYSGQILKDSTYRSAEPTQGGDNPETISEIKDNAPHWFESQYRAVTVNDYIAIIRKKFSDIQSISVYGGEEVGQPGKVFIAIKPKSADRLTDAVKNTITNEVLSSSNIVTITPVIVDPFIIKIVLKSVVSYDDIKLTTNATALRTKIFTMFDVFNETYIGDFLENFQESRLSTEISNLDNAVESSNTRVSLRHDVTVENNLLDKYEWTFNNSIYHPEAGFRADEGGVLSTNRFRRTGQTNDSGFDEDGNGNIRLFDWVGDNEKLYVNLEAGTINYATGEIQLSETGLTPVDGVIQFTVEPDSFDVFAGENTILEIAIDDSSVDVIERNNTATLKALSKTRSI